MRLRFVEAAPRIHLLLLCLAGASYELALASTSSPHDSGNSLVMGQLRLSESGDRYDAISGPPLLPYECHFWELSTHQMEEQHICTGEDSMLVLEFWPDVAPPGAELEKVYLAVSTRAHEHNVSEGYPKITYLDNSTRYSGVPKFDPPVVLTHPGPGGSTGSGTYMDTDAVLRLRPYQRVVLPIESQIRKHPANTRKAVETTWKISVINLSPPGIYSPSSTEKGYHLKAQCARADRVPCPRPLPTAPQCSGELQGSCVGQNASQDRHPLPRCICQPGWGGIHCQDKIEPMRNWETRTFYSAPASWLYFSVDPGPEVISQRTLLLDLHRSSFFLNGDPLLAAMPVPPGGSQQDALPWLGDPSVLISNRTFDLMQRAHYITAFDWEPGSTFVVGVYNAVTRATASEVNVKLRVEYSTHSAEPICPNDCTDSKRGTCWLNGTSPPRCVCFPGYGGTYCQGLQFEVSVASGSEKVFNDHLVAPGSWTFYKLSLRDTSSPSYVQVQWTLQASEIGRRLLHQGIITHTQNGYPSDSSVLRRWDFLSSKSSSSFAGALRDEDEPLKVDFNFSMGSFRGGEQFVVLGIYNTAKVQFTYSLKVWVPSRDSTPWMKPYLQAIIGVATFLVLCVTVTLARMWILRSCVQQEAYRPPFARYSTGGPSATVRMPGSRASNTAVPLSLFSHMSSTPSVPQGVPRSIFSDFESYVYKAPTAADGKGVQGMIHDSSVDGSSPSLTSGTHRQVTGQPGSVGETLEQATPSQTDSMGEPSLSHVGVGEPSSSSGQMTAGQPGNMAEASGQVSRQPGSSVDSCLDEAGAAPSSRPPHALMAADGHTTCSVCLGDYEDGEMLRRLPCGHEFHMECIDTWMMRHTTCPVCRTTMVPDPPEGGSRSRQTNAGQVSLGSWIMSGGLGGTVLLGAGDRDNRTHGGNQMGIVLVMYPSRNQGRRT